MTLALIGFALGAVGPVAGRSTHALDLDDDLSGTTGLLLAVGLGVGGAALLLAASWRPGRTP
jgi:putative oxidoreductase